MEDLTIGADYDVRGSAMWAQALVSAGIPAREAMAAALLVADGQPGKALEVLLREDLDGLPAKRSGGDG